MKSNYNKIVRPPLHKKFELPAREELLNAKIGDGVKLIFSQKRHPRSERMWVTATHQRTMEEWEGTPDNDTKELRLKYKDEIKFHPPDAIGIMRE